MSFNEWIDYFKRIQPSSEIRKIKTRLYSFVRKIRRKICKPPPPPPGWRTQTAIGWAHSRTPDPYLTEWSQGICKNWVPIFIKMKRWIYFPNIRIYRVLWTNGPLILISKWWFLNFLFWSNLLYLNVTSWFDLQRRGMIKKTFNHVSNNYTQ